MSSIGPNLYAIRAKGAFEKSKLKGTYPNDTNQPKEKHVQSTYHTAILWTLQGQNMETPPELAYNSLCQRLMTSEWVVALKTEIILHRAIEQVGPGFAARLAELNIPMQNFNDPSEKGSAHSRIIQDYFTYIKVKAVNYSRRGSVMLSAPPERGKLFDRMEPADLLKELKQLLSQLQGLIKMAPACDQALRNYHLKLTQNAIYVILTDATPLYMTCSIGIDRLIDKFQDMNRSLGEVAVEHFKGFEQAGRLLAKFFGLAQHLPYQLSPPSFSQRPREVILSMQSALGEKDDEGYSGSTGANEASPSVGADLHLSNEEMELQRQLLEQYERENEQRRLKEARESHREAPREVPREAPREAARELLSDPIQVEPQRVEPPKPREMTKADLIMASFETAPPATMPPGAGVGMQPNPGMPPNMGMNPMMNQMAFMSMMNPMYNPMMNPGMMNPGMMNPGMMNPGMMNPGMMNPGMMNPGMMYPGMMSAPQSQPPRPSPAAQSFAKPADPFSAPQGQYSNPKSTNPFETNSAPKAPNPFDEFMSPSQRPSAPAYPPARKPDPYGGNGSLI